MSHFKKKVTLKTIANLLNLTPATISKALRNSSDISDKTKRIVQQKADELGYHPNIMARTLINRRSHLLGVIVPDLRISFFSEVTRGIYEKARQLGYEAIIIAHDYSDEIEKKNLEFLAALSVDGVLIDAIPATKNIALLRQINEQGIPVVCFDRGIEELDLPAVTNDDEEAASKVIDYFVNEGRRDIVFLGPLSNLDLARSRYQGYCKALMRHNIEYKPELVVTCTMTRIDAYPKMQEFIKKNYKFNAVMVAGGLAAYHAGQVLIEAGISIPQDVILAEFGNNNIVHQLGISFVSVEQFPYEMGEKAVQLITDIIDLREPELDHKHIYIDTKLVFHHVKRSIIGEKLNGTTQETGNAENISRNIRTHAGDNIQSAKR